MPIRSGQLLAYHLKVKDRDILNSIRYHTTEAGDVLLEKVIYAADCIEETRNYEGVEELRKAVEEDFEKAFKMELKHNQLIEDDCKGLSLTSLSRHLNIIRNWRGKHDLRAKR